MIAASDRLHVFAEWPKAARGGVDAVGAAAEIDTVEVQARGFLEKRRSSASASTEFAALAAEGAAVGQEDVAGELLPVMVEPP